MYISIVEYGVQNYPNPQMEEEGWQFVRFEYHIEGEPFAFREDHLWLPPHLDLTKVEEMLNTRPVFGTEKEKE